MVLETISRIIKVQLPAYLKRLPLPETIGGFARLTGKWRRRVVHGGVREEVLSWGGLSLHSSLTPSPPGLHSPPPYLRCALVFSLGS